MKITLTLNEATKLTEIQKQRLRAEIQYVLDTQIVGMPTIVQARAKLGSNEVVIVEVR